MTSGARNISLSQIEWSRHEEFTTPIRGFLASVTTWNAFPGLPLQNCNGVSPYTSMSFQTFLKFIQEETFKVIVSKSHLLKSNSFKIQIRFQYEFVSNHFISGLPNSKCREKQNEFQHEYLLLLPIHILNPPTCGTQKNYLFEEPNHKGSSNIIPILLLPYCGKWNCFACTIYCPNKDVDLVASKSVGLVVCKRAEIKQAHFAHCWKKKAAGKFSCLDLRNWTFQEFSQTSCLWQPKEVHIMCTRRANNKANK